MSDMHNSVPIRDYIDAEIDAVREATTVAHKALEHRLDGMNEFRAALGDQSRTMVTRSEMDASLKSLLSDVDSLKESRAELRGKASQSSVTIAYVFAALGALLGVINLVIDLM